MSYMIRKSSTYRVYSAMFFVSRSWFMCMSSERCKNISVINPYRTNVENRVSS